VPYDDTDGTHLAKGRVHTTKGSPESYVYLNNVEVNELVGTSVDVKIRLIQGGEVVQAYHFTKTMVKVMN